MTQRLRVQAAADIGLIPSTHTAVCQCRLLAPSHPRPASNTQSAMQNTDTHYINRYIFLILKAKINKCNF